MKEVLRNNALITLGIAETISNLGNWITMLALFSILVFQGNGGIAVNSGIMLAGLAPLLVVSPIAGWIVDRYDRRSLMMLSQFLGALPIIGLFFARDLWLIYALLALQTIALSINSPARQAAVPDLVSKDQLTQANAFLQQLSSILKVAAPAIAGALVGAIGPHNAMIVDIFSFILAIAFLTSLPDLPPTSSQKATQSDNAEANDELQGGVLGVLRRSSQLQMLFVSLFFSILIIMGFDAMGTVYVRDVLQGDEAFFGLLIGLVGLGQVLAVLWLMSQKANPQRAWRDIALSLFLMSALCIGSGLAYFVESVTLARVLVLTGAFIGGIGNGIVTVQISTLLQLLSPKAALGRIGGAFQSTLVAGQLISIIGIPLLIPTYINMGQFYLAATVLLIAIASIVGIMTRKQPQLVQEQAVLRTQNVSS